MLIRLTKQMPERNISRYYLIQVIPSLFGEWGVLREWGRIGQAGTIRQDWYPDELQARTAALKIERQKYKRGYIAADIFVLEDCHSTTSSE
jgi:predicted DNA-binding WGR domain protein